MAHKLYRRFAYGKFDWLSADAMRYFTLPNLLWEKLCYSIADIKASAADDEANLMLKPIEELSIERQKATSHEMREFHLDRSQDLCKGRRMMSNFSHSAEKYMISRRVDQYDDRLMHKVNIDDIKMIEQ